MPCARSNAGQASCSSHTEGAHERVVIHRRYTGATVRARSPHHGTASSHTQTSVYDMLSHCRDASPPCFILILVVPSTASQ